MVARHKSFHLADENPAVKIQSFGVGDTVKLCQYHSRKGHFARERVARLVRGVHAQGVVTADVRAPLSVACICQTMCLRLIL